ncbi:YhfG family protein [Luteimonas sp. TWI1437]|uniref:YhfG family protein n=1 Tax=unclassified Luteimonas TaxID=2629088 RepID=UPI003209F789
MKTTLSDQALQWYLHHRRENFAASQRLEGIDTQSTRAHNTSPLPTREQLLKKYAIRSGR